MDINGFALVIGAGSGIGAQCALAYAQEGAAGVALADINVDNAQKVAESCIEAAVHPNFVAAVFQVDVQDASSMETLVNAVYEKFGRVDYAVHTAGIGIETPAEISDTSVADFERFISINVTGTFLAVRYISKAMKTQEEAINQKYNPARKLGRGVIIVMGSCNSFVATPHIVPYTSSKHAVIGIVKNAALDCAPYGIRVNCLCPSWVEGPMITRAVEGNPELKNVMERVVPLNRLAVPEEISDVLMFLSSPRSSYVTGSSWLVDGGATLQLQI